MISTFLQSADFSDGMCGWTATGRASIFNTFVSKAGKELVIEIRVGINYLYKRHQVKVTHWCVNIYLASFLSIIVTEKETRMLGVLDFRLNRWIFSRSTARTKKFDVQNSKKVNVILIMMLNLLSQSMLKGAFDSLVCDPTIDFHESHGRVGIIVDRRGRELLETC